MNILLTYDYIKLLAAYSTKEPLLKKRQQIWFALIKAANSVTMFLSDEFKMGHRIKEYKETDCFIVDQDMFNLDIILTILVSNVFIVGNKHHIKTLRTKLYEASDKLAPTIGKTTVSKFDDIFDNE